MLLILYERSDYQAIIKKINYYLKIQKKDINNRYKIRTRIAQ